MFLTFYRFFGLVSYLTQITVRPYYKVKIFTFVLTNQNRNVSIKVSEIQVRNFMKNWLGGKHGGPWAQTDRYN